MLFQGFDAQLGTLCQESQQTGLLAMEWIFTVVAVVVVSLRLYCRTKFGKGFGWDDYIFVTGAVCVLLLRDSAFKKILMRRNRLSASQTPFSSRNGYTQVLESTLNALVPLGLTRQ